MDSTSALSDSEEHRHHQPGQIMPDESITSKEASEKQEAVNEEPQVRDDETAGRPRDKGFYDILVIGKTGRGKSNTVDKLMIPASLVPLESTVDQDKTKDDIYDYRTLPNDPKEIPIVKKRLSNIESVRSSCYPHAEINKAYEEKHYPTRNCILFTNNNSKLRILDTPGFNCAEFLLGTSSTQESNAKITAHIKRLQDQEELKFQRTLYFLPQSGPLQRADTSLQEELQLLTQVFGKNIFSDMVLVATMPDHISKNPNLLPEQKFPKERIEESKEIFQECLVQVFREQEIKEGTNLPKPPIVFIAMTDTCEDILLKVGRSVCDKCGIIMYPPDENGQVKCTSTCQDSGKTNWINYDDSKCHPSFTISCSRQFLNIIRRQPSEKQCINCTRERGTPGCELVNRTGMRHTKHPYTS